MRRQAADIVGDNHFLAAEDGTDLRVQGVERLGGELLRHRDGHVGLLGGLLGLDEDEDRQVPRVLPGPIADNLQTPNERQTGAAIVHVRNVHHLEAGLPHDAQGVEGRILRQPGLRHQARARRIRVAAAARIGENVQFNLPHARRELRVERSVPVLQATQLIRLGSLPQFGLAGRDAGVIAVVRADHLDLVHAYGFGGGLRPGSGGGDSDRGRAEDAGVHSVSSEMCPGHWPALPSTQNASLRENCKMRGKLFW